MIIDGVGHDRDSAAARTASKRVRTKSIVARPLQGDRALRLRFDGMTAIGFVALFAARADYF
jgi:hypothetical protein